MEWSLSWEYLKNNTLLIKDVLYQTILYYRSISDSINSDVNPVYIIVICNAETAETNVHVYKYVSSHYVMKGVIVQDFLIYCPDCVSLQNYFCVPILCTLDRLIV